jgi:hypothetical protein
MQVRNNPKVILALLVAVFAVAFALALLSPAYITTISPDNSHVLHVVEISYLHPVKNVSSTSAPVNFTNYVTHYCVYRD